MKLVTYCELDNSIFDSKHSVEYYENSTGGADIAILDINSIFDFEENKVDNCKEKFVSLAVIDDEDDYSAFKNFGIDAWIKQEDISKINELLDILEKRFLS